MTDTKRRCVCPGSFDPVTLGHIDVFTRASAAFDEVVVAVLVNIAKPGRFAMGHRLDLLRRATADLPRVRVATFDGLLVDFCRREGIGTILKGVRSGADVEYEAPMAHMNRELAGVDTMFLPARPEWSFVSSSLVAEAARFGADIRQYLPPAVAEEIAAGLRPANR